MFDFNIPWKTIFALAAIGIVSLLVTSIGATIFGVVWLIHHVTVH